MSSVKGTKSAAQAEAVRATRAAKAEQMQILMRARLEEVGRRQAELRRRMRQKNFAMLGALTLFSGGIYVYLRLKLKNNAIQNVLEDMEPLPPEEESAKNEPNPQA
mmetsp:Transcript_6311/g.19055  ORF Transcript_6311/g.19055 Transcript_6311/m.19055 type:complete len:106 (-) Transcript_6311:1143-1460(-)